MNSIFGISFSVAALNLAYFNINGNGPELISVRSIAYPFAFSYDSLLDDGNLEQLAVIINSHKAEKNLKDISLAVSLPVNYTYPQHISVPIDAGGELLNLQAKWQLENYLSGELTDYKILKTSNEFGLDTYKDILFLAIRKEILQKISQLAQLCGASLISVETDFDSIQSFLHKYYPATQNDNQLVLKADGKLLETHIFIAGNYYQSYLYELERASGEALREALKERIKQSRTILEQLPVAENKSYSVFLSGTAVEPLFSEGLEEDLAQNVTLLKVSEEGFESSAIEAVGVVL